MNILGKAEGSTALDRRIAKTLHRHGIAPKPALVKELVEEVERLIIENRNSLNDPTTNEPYDVKGIADDVIQLIDNKIIEKLEEHIHNLRGTYNSVVKSGLAGPMKWELSDAIEKMEVQVKALNHRKEK